MPGAATVAERHLTDGPGKLCQALGIDRALNGVDLTTGDTLFIEKDDRVPDEEVRQTPRIGVRVRGSQMARTRPWRFLWQPRGLHVGMVTDKGY